MPTFESRQGGNMPEDKPLNPKTVEELIKESQEAEDLARLADYEMLPPEIPSESLRESRPDVAELETLFTTFEAEHDLEALHAITDLEPFTEAPNHPVREPARLGLVPIVDKLVKVIEKETDISDEQYAVLYERYMVLSRAIGVINKGKVDHTRTGRPTRSRSRPGSSPRDV